MVESCITKNMVVINEAAVERAGWIRGWKGGSKKIDKQKAIIQ